MDKEYYLGEIQKEAKELIEKLEYCQDHDVDNIHIAQNKINNFVRELSIN